MEAADTEAAPERRQDQRCEGHQAADADRPARLLGDVGGELVERVRLLEEEARLLDEAPAARCQRQAVRVLPDEELDAELSLELRDRRGDRWRRHVDPLGRPGHAAGFADGDEVGELAKGDPDHHEPSNATRRNRRQGPALQRPTGQRVRCASVSPRAPVRPARYRFVAGADGR